MNLEFRIMKEKPIKTKTVRLPDTSILVHGKPLARGCVRVPMELVPESWEVPESPPKPEHTVSYKVYRKGKESGRMAFYNCNPCERGGADQAQLQHLERQRIYFLNRGKLEWRWISEIEPQVFPDAGNEYAERGEWVIHYAARRR